MHQQFVNPTRERLKGLLHGTMGLTAGLYITLGLCGYLYAYEGTKARIIPRGGVVMIVEKETGWFYQS